MKRSAGLLLSVISFGFLVAAVMAAELTGTLKKIMVVTHEWVLPKKSPTGLSL